MRAASRVPSALVTIAAVMLLASRAAGQEVPVGFEGRQVVGPFTRLAADGVWTQRTAIIANRTDVPRLVKVGYVTSGAGGKGMLFSRIVTVAPHSIRRADMAVRPGGSDMKPKPGRRLHITQAYVLWDVETGGQLQKIPMTEPVLGPGTTSLANVLDWNLAEQYDEHTYLKDLSGDTPPLGPVRFLGSDLRELPDRWYAYGAAKFVMVRGLRPATLRPSQVEAMLDWLRRGGQVVLMGSHELPEMLRSRLGRMAGVAVLGVHRIAELRARRIGKKGNSTIEKEYPPVRLDYPLPMVELCPAGAKVLYEANGLPLLTSHKVGNGRIFVLAVPPAALRGKSVMVRERGKRALQKKWSSPLHEIWSTIHKPPSLRPAVDPDRFLNPPPDLRKKKRAADGKPVKPAEDTLKSIAGRRAPMPAVPVAILGGLAGLVLVLGLVLRLRRRGELLWVVLLPVALLIGIAIYAYSAGRIENARLSTIGLIYDLGDGKARVQQVFQYYSGPRSGPVSFSAGGPAAVIREIGKPQSGAMGKGEVRSGRELSLPDLLMANNSSRAFYVDGVRTMRGVTGRLTFGPAGLTGRLENHLGAGIENAVIYVNRRSYRLGKLPARVGTEIAVSDRQALGAGEFTGSLVNDLLDSRRNTLMKRIITQPYMNYRIESAPLLIGYTTYSPLSPLADGNYDKQGWCVVVWPLRISPPPAGTKVYVPSGFVTLDYEKSLVWSSSTEEFIEKRNDAEVVVVARPLVRGLDLKDSVAHLKISILAANYKLSVYSGRLDRNRPAAGTLIREFENPSGVLDPIRVPDADRFARPDGTYVFTLKVSRLRGPEMTSGVRSPWKFESIEIALEGVSR